jgi:hypothetical protein
MKISSCLYIIFISLSFLNCTSQKTENNQEFVKYVILCKKNYEPKQEDFLPHFLLTNAKKVNKTKNEWIITVKKSDKNLTEIEDFLKNLPFVISFSSSTSSKSNSVNSKKSKTSISKK